MCAAEYNETSQWWTNVRDVLSNSTNPFHALIIAMACRVVASTLEKNKELCGNITEDNNGNVGDDNKYCNDFTKADTPSTEEAPNSDIKSAIGSSITTQSSISEWENVSTETCQFSLLIGNLEDITTLSAIVR